MKQMYCCTGLEFSSSLISPVLAAGDSAIAIQNHKASKEVQHKALPMAVFRILARVLAPGACEKNVADSPPDQWVRHAAK